MKQIFLVIFLFIFLSKLKAQTRDYEKLMDGTYRYSDTLVISNYCRINFIQIGRFYDKPNAKKLYKIVRTISGNTNNIIKIELEEVKEDSTTLIFYPHPWY